MAKTSQKKTTEVDLSHPIHSYLTDRGYTVRSEVNDCDIAATRDGELVVIELKRSFSTALLIQAARRQRAADSVYVALPRPTLTPRWRDIQHLLRRLEVGLIFVSLGRKPKVEVAFHPLPFQRKRRRRDKQAILTEMAGRSGDFNHGGSARRKLVTAYREKAIHIACCLDLCGPLSPRALRAMGTAPNTQSILYSDYYGWFERVSPGVYSLKQKARAELAEYPDLVEHYHAAIGIARATMQTPGRECG
jgi:hypothetical protein